MSLDDIAKRRLTDRLKEGGEELYLEAIHQRNIDQAVQERLTDKVREIMDGMVDEGIMERVPGGRYQLADTDGEIARTGHRVVPTTAEDTVRQVFPLAFPAHPYSRWEDAMVEQVRLHEFTGSFDGRRYVDSFQQDMNSKHPPNARMPDGFFHALQMMVLTDAEPVWVDAEVIELVNEARGSFAPEPIRPSDPFVPTGFALFAAPIPMHDAPITEKRPYSSVDGITLMRAMAWTSVISEDPDVGCFWISFYNHIDDDPGHHDQAWDEDAAAYWRRHCPLALSHTFQWTWGTMPTPHRLADIAVEGEDPEDSLARAREQAQTVQTLWRLAAQFIPVKHQAPRGMRRDAKRKLKRELSDVNVVVLRRTRAPFEGEETGREINVTFLCHGYWAVRHTREGPRQVWVRPHIKGKGPFKETRRAWEFRR